MNLRSQTISLAWRFVLWFITLVLLPLAVLGWVSLQQDELALRSQALNRMSAIADKKSLQIKSYLNERRLDAELLARSSLAKQALLELSAVYRSDTVGSEVYQSITKRYQADLASYLDGLTGRAFYDVFLISPQGEVIYSHQHEADFASNLLTGPYRHTSLAQAFRESSMTMASSISSFEFYPPSNMPAAFITTPVLRNGVLLGMVAFQLDNQRIYQIALDSMGLGETGETVLAKIIAPNEAIFVAPLRYDAFAAMKRKIDLRTSALPVRYALAGQHGSGEVIDYAGHQVIAAWRYLPELDWGMAVKMDVQEVLHPLAQQGVVLLEILLSLTLLGSVVAWRMARKTVLRLQNFACTANAIAQGDLNKRVDEQGHDEIAELARTFNHMSEKLQKLYATLEERIQERTCELNDSNQQLQKEIIERHRMEYALRESQAFFETLSAVNPVGIYRTDVAGRCQFVNARWCAITGLKEAEAMQPTWLHAIHPDDREKIFACWQDTLQGCHGEYRFVHSNGQIVWVYGQTTAIHNEQGELTGYLGTITEITELKQIEKQLQMIRMGVEHSFDCMYWANAQGRIVDLNDAPSRLLGYSRAELLQMSVHDIDASLPADVWSEHYAQVREQKTLRFESIQRSKTGVLIPVEIVSNYLRLAGEEYAFAIVRDISERKQAEEQLRIAAVTFETHEAIMITDANANIIRVNQAFQNITGYSAAEVEGKTPAVLSSGRQNKKFYEGLWQQLLNTGSWTGEIWNKRKSGEVFPEWLTISAVKDKNGKTSEYVAVFSDITARKQSEDEIRSLAFYDVLTKLPNRRFLLERFHQVLAVSARSCCYGAVYFIDMDKFKTLNDTLGHDYGDLLLVEVAKRIAACVRETDTIVRLGGDEFVVLLEEVDKNIDAALYIAAQVAEKIRLSLASAYQLNNSVYYGSPSIGVCLYRGHEDSVDTLLKRADMAMYKAKDSGRNAVKFFDPIMQSTLENRAALELDLRQAIGKQQLCLYYQIQLNRELQPLGAEALVRWIHPQRGLVSPAQFIPIAEESTLIIDIGSWVLKAACQQIALWQQRASTSHLVLAVNVSSAQFKQSNFVSQIQTLLETYNIPAENLKLELTESVVLDDIDEVINKMRTLQTLGISLSLDDFGTGYSSLSYLKQLPLNQIKIDQSFVRDITSDHSDAIMVKTIIGLAENFGLNVIAEGVEQKAQHYFLHKNGCMAYQGYLFSKPLPITEFEALLEKIAQGRGVL